MLRYQQWLSFVYGLLWLFWLLSGRLTVLVFAVGDRILPPSHRADCAHIEVPWLQISSQQWQKVRFCFPPFSNVGIHQIAWRR